MEHSEGIVKECIHSILIPFQNQAIEPGNALHLQARYSLPQYAYRTQARITRSAPVWPPDMILSIVPSYRKPI